MRVDKISDAIIKDSVFFIVFPPLKGLVVSF